MQKAEERNRDATYSNIRGTIASRSMYLPGERASLVPEVNAVCVTTVTWVVVPGEAPGEAPGDASVDAETVVCVDVG